MTAASSISLDGKVVLITGGGRGIGRETALAMADAGASVVVNDIDADAARGVVAEIRESGGRATAHIGAIGPTAVAEGAIATATDTFGRLDVVACNAGLLRDRTLWNTSDEDFDVVIETHLRGTFTCARAAARHFREAGQGGRLILVSSIAGQRGNFGQTAYSAAKAGIAALARTWSLELGRYSVTVNAIVPNALTLMTETIPALKPFNAMIARGEPLPAKLRKDLGIGGPEDVAAAFVYLASERSAGITGQCIGIGGDRLSIWSHPVEAAHRLSTGGWTADALGDALEGPLSGVLQDVGVDLKLAP